MGSIIVVVNKKGGSFRFCIDYINLNMLLEELNGGSSFSKFVLASRYHQIAIAEEYVRNADFRYGYYEFVVIPFGSTKALRLIPFREGRNLRALQRSAVLFGLIVYYWKFIKGFTGIVMLKTRSTCKDVKCGWIDFCSRSFTELKHN
ncbi:hypothetical protein YC2023_008489 [Brassica napus]